MENMHADVRGLKGYGVSLYLTRRIHSKAIFKFVQDFL